MKTVSLSAVAILALAGSAMAQSFGSVEFRWRERGLGLTNVADIGPGVTGIAGAALNQTTNPTLTTDARFVLVLEARVTRASGNTDLGGLAGMAFNFNSSDTSAQGQFAATVVGASADLRNAASASPAVYTSIGGYTALPAADLPGGTSGARGIFGPFRTIADIGSPNQPAIGVQNGANLNNIAIAANTSPLTFVDPDTGDNGPYFGRTDFYGLNTWVPVFTAVYNVADVSTIRTITLTPALSGTGAGDSGLRGFRGINNSQGVDSWQIDNGGLPAFSIRVIPAPGAAALLGLGGLVAARRRRA